MSDTVSLDRCLYSNPFVPPEWIAAHGIEPCRVRATTPESTLGAGVCPFASGLLDRLRDTRPGDGLVLTTECDQMRRVAETTGCKEGSPSFLLNLPATCHTAARELYASELRRLGSFLVEGGGSAPSDGELARVMRSYDAMREQLRRVAGRCRPRAFAAAVHGPPSVPAPPLEDGPGRIPVAVIGGPLSTDDLELFDLIEDAGGRVVLDGTETGERTVPRPFDKHRLRRDPFRELLGAYFDGIPEVWQRPNDHLYRWLVRVLSARRPAGVILVRCVWCDLWHGEVARLKDALPVPLLDLDLNGEDILGRNRTRLAAFMEMLS